MSDLYAAGGLGAVLRELKPLLHLDCMTVAGVSLKEVLDKLPAWVDRAVIKPFSEPLSKQGGLVALFGSLAPNGAILRRASTIPASTSPRKISSCCRTPGPNRATPCPRRAICRFRRSWRAPA